MDGLFLSVLFQPWHKLAEFQWTCLYQTPLCRIHGLSLSTRVKIAVRSRLKPAHTGAAGRGCVCVVLRGQGFGLDGRWVYLPCPRSLPVAVSLTQLVRTARGLFQLRVQNPDITPLSVRTGCYHLRFCDSEPWCRCLSRLAQRRELSLRKWKKTFFTLLISSILSEISLNFNLRI